MWHFDLRANGIQWIVKWALQTLTNLQIYHCEQGIKIHVSPKVALEIQDEIAFDKIHIFVVES